MSTPSTPSTSRSIFSQRLSASQLLPSTEDFRKILGDVGVTLISTPDKPHILNQEQALVVRELNKYFQNDEDQHSGVKFLSGLKYLCKKEKHFKKCLIPTHFQKSFNDNKSIYQDSLFSIFLKIPRLQHDIIELLLDGVTATAVEETQDTSWLRTLLRPLRCLPTIKNGEALAKKILDILEISTFTCQLEILEAIPEILPDNQCDLAAKRLTKLLDEDDELCGAIVDCLTALNLEADMSAQIHDRILARISAGVSLKVYLILIKFLISDYKPQNLVSTLLKIRNSLDNMVRSSRKDKESDKTLIFHYLQTSAVTQKAVAEGWLNTISNIKVHTEHKPIDLLIIFMLHHTSEIRKKVIEAIFRKRVSAGLFKISLLDEVFEKYITQQLLKDYMGDIINIGCYLLRFAKDGTVAKFATTLFENLFNHIYTGAIYRGEILSGLISLVGYNDHYTISTALKIILSLVAIDHQKVQTHIPLLLLLLEKLDTLDFKDVKIVFDILCSLLCGDRVDESFSGFKDQIYNTIRKQLSCFDRTIKHRGIISAIVMVKHTASVENGEMDCSSMEGPITSLGNLPNGPAKEAAELLELVYCATGDNPELLCLYYDQLASVLASEQPFDKYFLYWLYQKVQYGFEGIFLTSTVPETTDELNFARQYVLNKPDETDITLAINIASYTICDKNNNILLLAPYFRVLRLLHFRQHDNLSKIDSLLGCGVILPQENDPDDLDANQIKQVVDCLFHCINWFREIISAFVSQRGSLIRERVVKRLDQLIQLENKLFALLKEVPGHNLPLSYFHSVQNISKQLAVKTDSKTTNKNPRKKFKSAAIIDNNDTTTNITINTQDASKSASVPNSKKGSSVIHNVIHFRELDTDIIRLIKYPLNLDQTEMELTNNAKISLNLHQVKFILNDFISKLTSLTQNKDMGLSHLNDVNPENLIRDCVRIVPNVNTFLQVIVNKINELLKQPEDTYYTDEANDIKTCFGIILQIFCLIFQWPGFQQTGNIELLKNILKSTRDANASSQTSVSVNRLIQEFVIKIENYKTNCLHLSHAVSLLKVMEILCTLTVHTTDIQKRISWTAEEFLSKRWYDFSGKLDQGQLCNQNIDVLAKAYLKNVKAETISGIVEQLLEDIADLQPKDGCSKRFPAIDHKNFHVFYLGLCNALLNSIKNEIQSLSNTGHMLLWFTVANTLTNLMKIAKQIKNRNNLSCFLKKTIAILKVFLTHGIPIMEIMFKSKSDEVLQIVRTIQTTTRFLHHLCCQSKITRDSSVVAHIPLFKHTIESIIYRVKAALVANDITSAFWLGNLRNRDIDGEDIVSQSTVVSSVEGDPQDGNDHLPSDDDNDENIINNEHSDNDADESVESEVYA